MERDEILQLISDEMSLALSIDGDRVCVKINFGNRFDLTHEAVAYLPNRDPDYNP